VALQYEKLAALKRATTIPNRGAKRKIAAAPG
jgi:hypothetical protein